jgi:phage shock protein A
VNDLIKKLNVLIKAGINDVLEDVQKAAPNPSKFIPQSRLGANIENEVDNLRQRINQALDYENSLQEKIDTVQQDIDNLDRKADAALEQGDEANARYYVERLHRAQQRKTMLENDLKEHRIAAQELMMRVNELDATISEARHREQQAARQEPPPQRPAQAEPQPQETQQKEPDEMDEVNAARERAYAFSQQAGKMLSDVLQEAREKIEQMDDRIEAKTEIAQQAESAAEEAAAEVEKSQIDDDIAARRSRLSAPPKPHKPDA